MIQILLIISLVLLGVCLYLWASISFGSEGERAPKQRTPKPTKQPKPRQKQQSAKKKKAVKPKRKGKKQSPEKRMEEVVSQTDTGSGFKFDLDDDPELSDLGIGETRNIPDQFDLGTDEALFPNDDIPIKKDMDLDFGKPTPKQQKSIEDEFSELFQEEETANFGSSKSTGLTGFGGSESNEFEPTQAPSTNQSKDDLSFLEQYDFSGGTEEKIDTGIFDKKDSLPKDEFDDLEHIKMPKIKGLNYEEEKLVEPNKDTTSNSLDDDEVILKRLEELKNRL